MQAIRDAMTSTELPRGVIATIGNYDGIHIGQQSVLDMVTGRAREVGAPSAVITFDPHPLSVVRPEEAPPRLVTQDQKEALLAAAGVDYVLTIRFSHEFSNTRARTFVRDFLHGQLAALELYVGSNFTFGRRREGNMALLREMGTSCGFVAVEIDEVRSGGERVSSSRIRSLVLEGRIAEANDLLGRPYTMTGTIARGDRMGQRLGWPTINLAPDNELYPHNGVYVTKVYFPSFEATFRSVTNIGTRPTVYENYRRVIESHILDFSSDVYGERVDLSFCRHLREEKLFSSMMDLSAQIGRDADAAREYFRRLESSTNRPN